MASDVKFSSARENFAGWNRQYHLAGTIGKIVPTLNSLTWILTDRVETSAPNYCLSTKIFR
ncbi:hypothetical protein [Chamaesiphon sp. VAR_48_metabat_403]|uniref:hypothetical protein n=1 Tax=Chamaesiphon sp. VAR_48_metabat_403 TaxID=2964700 RepID=UPI00286DC912|nr:hypothetical protein [Chamaesiphon sp. VAR_48_metabat_403]